MFLKKYKLKFLRIKFIENCIKDVQFTKFEKHSDKVFTLNNYNKYLDKLRKEKGLFTKIY